MTGAEYRRVISFFTSRAASAFRAWTSTNTRFFRCPAFGHFGLLAEEKLFHLLAQHLARFRVAHIQPIVIDNQRTLRGPPLLGLLPDLFIDALSHLAWAH